MTAQLGIYNMDTKVNKLTLNSQAYNSVTIVPIIYHWTVM